MSLSVREYLEHKTRLNMSNEDDVNFVIAMFKQAYNYELTRDELLKDNSDYLDYIRNLPEEHYNKYVEYLRKKGR